MNINHLNLLINLLTVACLTSCIPYKTTYSDSVVLGQRLDHLSNKTIQIERRKNQIHAIGLLHPDGFGTKAVLDSTYQYYLLRSDGTEQSLSHISKSGTDYAYLHEILPVEGSDLWVAFWLDGEHVRKDFVDVNIIVFNESKVLHKNHIKESIRTYKCGWEYSCGYSIFPQKGNENILFKTTNGDIIYNVKENSFNNNY